MELHRYVTEQGRQGGQISGGLLARQTRILIRNETSMPGNGVHCVLGPFTSSIVYVCVGGCVRWPTTDVSLNFHPIYVHDEPLKPHNELVL